MTLLDVIPRQPTQRDIDDCDWHIEVWRRQQLGADVESPWAATCAGVIDEWLDVRSQLAAILQADAGSGVVVPIS